MDGGVEGFNRTLKFFIFIAATVFVYKLMESI